jgi:hypothetical protein
MPEKTDMSATDRSSEQHIGSRYILTVHMKTQDFGLRYVSPRRWCWRANDGSWRDVPKWSVKLYLTIECGLNDKHSKETAMKEAIENFQVDIVGDYRFDKQIYDSVNRFGHCLPIDHNGVLRAGEYNLRTGERMLLLRDVQRGLMA